MRSKLLVLSGIFLSLQSFAAECDSPGNMNGVDRELCIDFASIKNAGLQNGPFIPEMSEAFKKYTHTSFNGSWLAFEKGHFLRRELSSALASRQSWDITYFDFYQLISRLFGEDHFLLSREYIPSVEAILIRINTEVTDYLRSPEWKKSPLASAIEIRNSFIQQNGNHENLTQVGTLLGDLLLVRLGFPPLSSSVQLNENELRDLMKALNHELNACLKPGNQITDREARNCLAYYHSNRADQYKSVLETLVMDQIQYGGAFGRADHESICGVFDYLGLSSDLKFRLNLGKRLSDNEKRTLFRRLAVPLQDDMRTWTWVTNSGARFSREWLYNNSYVFSWGVVGKSGEPKSKSVQGNGLYVSKNPFDSAQYGLSDSEKSAAQKISEKEIENRNGILLLVVLKKGTRILDMTNSPVTFNPTMILSQALGIPLMDLKSLNPNLVVDYSTPDHAWMVVKARGEKSFSLWSLIPFTEDGLFSTSNSAFQMKEVTAADFTEQELELIRSRLKLPETMYARKYFEEILRNRL